MRGPQREGHMNNLRRTKIVVTLGPSLDDSAMLKRVIIEGADVFRANFSHGTQETTKNAYSKCVILQKSSATP